MTMNKVQNDIAQGNFSTTELNQLITFIQGVKTNQAKRSISVGDAVFVVQKTKKTRGTVVKIKIKKAVVDMDGKGRYNVPLAMLELA
jgi:prefoldin subunit 5|tara:strand:+ start:240 stop:500 length:261 start_codon:yes stop_codon:yes gene_type:complete